MLGAGHFLAEFAFVGSRYLMPDKLLFGVRMLAFTQPREVLSVNCTGELPVLGEPALPFAMALLIAAPVVLFLRNKLARVVNTRLAGCQRFRDRKLGEGSSNGAAGRSLHLGLMG